MYTEKGFAQLELKVEYLFYGMYVHFAFFTTQDYRYSIRLNHEHQSKENFPSNRNCQIPSPKMYKEGKHFSFQSWHIE